MKILTVYTSKSKPCPSGRKVMVLPDSALIRSGKPFFLPEGVDTFFVGFALRASAVGKNIKKTYAGRYYNGVAPVALFLNETAAAAIEYQEDPVACDLASDYCMICGDFVAPAEMFAHKTLKLSVRTSLLKDSSSKTGNEEIEITDIRELADSVIEDASVTSTLKTGDIAACILHKAFKAVEDSLLRIKCNEQLLMENKLK